MIDLVFWVLQAFVYYFTTPPWEWPSAASKAVLLGVALDLDFLVLFGLTGFMLMGLFVSAMGWGVLRAWRAYR